MFYRSLIKELEKWKESAFRKPLVIRGARQVGKTTLIKEFGKQFKQFIFLNLEKEEDAMFFKTKDKLEDIIQKIFINKKKLLSDKHRTLLFIDEIQEVPEAVNLLRYFKEDLPELAVIAAGSMLESLVGKNLTFPVGRIEYRVLRPLSFDEFLLAMGDEMYIDELNKIPVSKNAENALLNAFHTYALLGGMPEAVYHYQHSKDITALSPIYDALINSYLDDAEKYAKSTKQLHLIRFCIKQAMSYAGKRTSYQRFGNANYSSNDIREVLAALEKTHLLQVIHPVTSAIIPLEPNYKKTPRLQFLDSGLINYFLGLQKDIIGTKDLNTIYKGTLIEHLVGQELLSFQSLSLNKLHFWVREKNQSDAEIDYLYPHQGALVPIEVKSGATGTLRSLQVFMDQSPLNYAIRLYAGKLQIDTIQTANGKSFYLLSMPYFLASKIEHYIDWLKTQFSYEVTEEAMTFKEPSISMFTKKTRKEKKWTIEELTEKHFRILALCKEKPLMGRQLIEEGLGLTYQSRNKKEYIKPLIDLQLIEYTQKDFKKSKTQKYQLTEAGLGLVKKIEN